MLRYEVEHADLHTGSNSASVLVRDAPSGDYVVETKVRLDGLPDEGCCFNWTQAGIVIYGDDDHFVKLTETSIWETRQTEWAKEVPQYADPDLPRYGNGVVGAPGDVTSLRVVVDRRPGEDRFTAFTRSDGGRWVRGGTWTHELGPDSRIGLVSMGGEGFTARFLEVRTSALARR